MKLKIGGHIYEVQFVDGVGITVGRVIAADNIIKISKDMTDSQKEVTLMHEIIHALSDNFGMDLTEQVTSILGEGLYQVLKDNYSLNLLDIENGKDTRIKKKIPSPNPNRFQVVS